MLLRIGSLWRRAVYGLASRKVPVASGWLRVVHRRYTNALSAALRYPSFVVSLSASRWLLRRANGVRKVLAGLRPFSESVWPGVCNDLFVAHQSIYAFAAGYCSGKRVLDAGCGTGYGSFYLAQRDAQAVTGVDLDARSIRFARRHFQWPHLSFQTADLEALSLEQASFDAVVASNSLEHLEHPQRFFEKVRPALTGEGVVVVAVPPIRNAEELAQHADIAYHRAPLPLDRWVSVFTSAGFSIRYVLHQLREQETGLDFSSPAKSRYGIDDFVFRETSREGLQHTPTLTALFVLRPS
jgi:2-polyprenyl-3-methyl-5-hydroxy-6-metoxy-1,4-benzoquinol methylase